MLGGAIYYLTSIKEGITHEKHAREILPMARTNGVCCLCCHTGNE